MGHTHGYDLVGRGRCDILPLKHDMRLVSGICEELTVLNFGQILAQGETGEVLNDPKVITAYLVIL